MVNDISKNRKLIKILESSDDFLSGENLAKSLEISRVAVWKRINKLMELGYPIQKSANGYRLIENRDFLFPWEISADSPVFYAENTDSTMIQMNNLRQKSDKTLFIAESQSEGKGQFERKWDSDKGGLYFSFYINSLKMETQKFNLIPLYCLYIISKTISEKFDISTSMKWPNDLYHDSKKLAGVLVQANTSANIIESMNIGVGLNVNNPVKDNSVSLAEITGCNYSRKEILNHFYSNFFKYTEILYSGEIIDIWKTNSFLLQKKIELTDLSSKTYEGRVKGLDNLGGIILDKNEETIGPFYSAKNLKIL